MDQLYNVAAEVLEKLDENRISFRNLVLQTNYKNKKLLYKVCLEVNKRSYLLKELMHQSQRLQKDKFESPYLLLVLLYEYLYNERGLRVRSKVWREALETAHDEIIELKCRLESQTASYSGGTGTLPDDTTTYTVPRYARVNLLKSTVDDVLSHLKNDGWELVTTMSFTRKRFTRQSRCLKPMTFCVDMFFPYILVFPVGTDLHDHPLVVENKLILQDKSSCLATESLAPPPGSAVLDGCAAPGMKTSHLASLMNDEGVIYAYDRDYDRVELMSDLLWKMGVQCAKLKCQDLMRLDLSDYNDVSHVLLDVPCSCSGIVNRIDTYEDKNMHMNRERVKKLSNLQAMLLKHALQLPNLKRLVYSTCSIYEEENEMVVKEALETFCDRFELIDALPKWKRRGSDNYEFGNLCLTASTEKDATNGFFVATFQRREI